MRNQLLLATVAVTLLAGPVHAQVTKPTVPGVTNFAKLESTIALGLRNEALKTFALDYAASRKR